MNARVGNEPAVSRLSKQAALTTASVTRLQLEQLSHFQNGLFKNQLIK